ncbi:MAG: flagellar hook-basal body complex protein FliE [Deltaproteobacteria bacterium]|nr:flagellar hook-basal body complex protein FliE [Deltaproteobacteria bacterium]MBW2069735.1 flagellar hook-basal body complex protein FliE [Deltaproteobacteria bacterium]
MTTIGQVTANHELTRQGGSGKRTENSSFGSTLKQVWNQLDAQLKQADRAAEEFASGASANIHEVMLATSKAELSFRLATAVRNKLIEAYREIMRMQF